MKRKDIIEVIQKTLEKDGDGYHSNTASDVLDAIEKAGMLPITKKVTFSGVYTIYKFEEDITEEDRDYAIRHMGVE